MAEEIRFIRLWCTAGDTACGCRYSSAEESWLIPDGHPVHNGYGLEFDRFIFENPADREHWQWIAWCRKKFSDPMLSKPPVLVRLARWWRLRRARTTHPTVAVSGEAE